MSQKPCLAVDSRVRKQKRDAVSTFDDIQQMDAATYLCRVMAEASRLPDIFQAASPPSQEKNCGSSTAQKRARDDSVSVGSVASARYLVSHRTALHPPPTIQHAPGRQWTEHTLADFARLRRYLSECQAHGVGVKGIRCRAPVPAMKDASAWHVFCVGRDDAAGNPGGYFQDSDDDTDWDDDVGDETKKHDGHAAAPWKANLPATGHAPTVGLLLQMDQVMVRRVLGHLAHYVSARGFCVTGQRAAWIYALLARLERPLHRDDAVTLYSLLKRLSVLRAQISLDDVSRRSSDAVEFRLPTLNVLIAIAGIYFEQGGGYANVMEAKTE